jgi:hypothetical protein
MDQEDGGGHGHEWEPIDDRLYAPLRGDVFVLTKHVHAHRHGNGAAHVHWHDHTRETVHEIPATTQETPPLHEHLLDANNISYPARGPLSQFGPTVKRLGRANPQIQGSIGDNRTSYPGRRDAIILEFKESGAFPREEARESSHNAQRHHPLGTGTPALR